MTSPIPDKFQRRIEMIECAIQSISRTVERSYVSSYLRYYRDESRYMKDKVRSKVTLVETALRELKDLLEDNSQEENRK